MSKESKYFKEALSKDKILKIESNQNEKELYKEQKIIKKVKKKKGRNRSQGRNMKRYRSISSDGEDHNLQTNENDLKNEVLKKVPKVDTKVVKIEDENEDFEKEDMNIQGSNQEDIIIQKTNLKS